MSYFFSNCYPNRLGSEDMLIRKHKLNPPPEVIELCQTLHHAGYQVYLVGGAIRDTLLGQLPTDWDVTTDATPDQIEGLFKKTIPTGKQFGTITVIIKGNGIEVTTMRQDAHYSNQRHPDYVLFTTDINQDLSRRDFTINAIAYDPFRAKFIDPYQGMADIKRKRLRTVGDPRQRFKEDALRMMRLIRFSATLGFRVDKKTRTGIESQLINQVANERILVEFNKLLLAENIIKPLKLMYTSGLMQEVLPELAAGKDVEQGSYHHWDVLGHSILTCQSIAPKLHLRWAALLHDLGKPITISYDERGTHFYGHDTIGAELAETVLRRLTASKELQTRVSLLIKHHMFQLHPHSSDKAFRRLIRQVGKKEIMDLLELRKADIVAAKHNPKETQEYYSAMQTRINQILDEEHAFSLKDLAISGNDLINELHIPPSPLVGAILNSLLDQVVDNPELNNYSTLINLAKDYLKDN